MEQIIIRQASMADMDTLLRFEQGVITAERPFDATLKADPNHYYDLEEMIRAEHIELLVAVSGDETIGSGYARIKKSKHYLQHSHHAYLGFMYVLPAWRGKGVNSLIIGALKDWALTRGITELRLDVYTGNASAIAAYEKFGFSQYMIQMRMGIHQK
jgi:GNAT superfamily N-acetyltransferase